MTSQTDARGRHKRQEEHACQRELTYTKSLFLELQSRAVQLWFSHLPPFLANTNLMQSPHCRHTTTLLPNPTKHYHKRYPFFFSISSEPGDGPLLARRCITSLCHHCTETKEEKMWALWPNQSLLLHGKISF